MTYEEFLVDFRAFCVKYQAWVDGGAPDEKPFRRDHGLCDNYAAYRETFYGAVNFYRQKWFLARLFGEEYPFGEVDYIERSDSGTLHECPKRLAFVKRMIENGAP